MHADKLPIDVDYEEEKVCCEDEKKVSKIEVVTQIQQIGEAVYQGDLLNGLKHGKGRYKDARGVVYDGFWRNDLAWGRGIQTYDGFWRNDLAWGRGIQTWPNGDEYEGYFVRGLKQGKGNIFFYKSMNYFRCVQLE